MPDKVNTESTLKKQNLGFHMTVVRKPNEKLVIRNCSGLTRGLLNWKGLSRAFLNTIRSSCDSQKNPPVVKKFQARWRKRSIHRIPSHFHKVPSETENVCFIEFPANFIRCQVRERKGLLHIIPSRFQKVPSEREKTLAS